LDKENPVPDIPPRLHIRYKLVDGRVSALIVWPDGEWKVEIFASVEHVFQFAARNPNMEIIDHDDNQRTERE